MANIFNSIRLKKPGRNTFNLSHEVKMSGNMGNLMPFACMPVMPGDKFRVNTEMLLRFAPMVSPVMHRVNVYTHFFFVPNRLVWDNWETFVTGGEDGTETPVFPTFKITEDYEHKPNQRLADYLGINSSNNETMNGLSFSQLPFRAYQLIWNEYYRDQNLQQEIDIHKDFDGEKEIEFQEDLDDWAQLLLMRQRAWEKDYFTSSLPWTQRGPDSLIPITGTVDLINRSTEPTKVSTLTGQGLYPGSTITGSSFNLYGSDSASTMAPINIDVTDSTYGQLGDGVNVTINDLRRANALQRWYEKNARGGSRYIEQILSHFGVKSSDARLQRPEFLGGGKSPVVISEVLQTSQSDSTPQGNMAGHGLSAGANHAFTRSFEEHGYIIGIMSVMPKPAYQQGIPRHFSIKDKFDLPWPEFAHLGEQEILNKEIYATGNSSDDELFGYTPRYAEYKYHPSRVAGDFRHTLDFWHLGRIFDSAPALNGDFVTCDDTNLDRIFAVDDNGATDKLWIQIYNDIKAIRPLPKYGTPSL